MAQDLFTPIVPLEQTHPLFRHIRQGPGHEAARQLMNLVFAQFRDVDGSFVREFQTGGFSARVFELALFAYLQEQALDLDRAHPAPDFHVRGRLPVAIEVTTTNPPQPSAEGSDGDEPTSPVLVPPNLPEADRAFVFQLGKALRRKLLHRDAQGRAYWQKSHVAGMPFVIAVGAFHDQHAQWHPVGLVSEYLYGTRDIPEHNTNGSLTITAEQITEHTYAGRVIPSGLFTRPEARYLSGVLFSNSHTVSIFNRIGTEQGLGSPDAALCRFGTCYDPDPNASTPQPFAYVVGDRPPEDQETFTEGLHLFLNPHAVVPLPPETLPGVTYYEQLPDGKVMPNLASGLHAFVSRTLIFEGKHAPALARYHHLSYLGLLPEHPDSEA